MTKASRPTSLEEMASIQSKMFGFDVASEGIKTVNLRPTDIVITPFAKCGTTWLQQMVHTLRTRGDMDFDDISRVVPWIETSPGLGIDLNGEQRAFPRAFKSHLSYDAIPKGAKYINAVRNPGDALYSAYKFMEGWFFEPGSISLEEFGLARFIRPGSYWKHLKSWLEADEPNLLLFAYEKMRDDLETTIRRVAEFIDVPLDDELLGITMEHASLAFMQKHGDRFDDALMRKQSEVNCGLPPGSESSKVRDGKVGSHKETLSPILIEALEEAWKKEIAPLGYPDYQSLISSSRFD